MKKYTINSISKNLAALVLGLFISLTMMEVGLRIFPPFETRLRGSQIVLPTNKQYTYDGTGLRGVDETIIHSKNSLGFRGPEFHEDIEYRLKIIAIGGSTTECIYLSDGKDWPSLLQKQLAKEFGPVWMNNAGLDGHSTIGHTLLYKDFIANMQPDIVILLVGINDLAVKDDAGEQTANQIKGRIRFNSLEAFIKSSAAYSEITSVSLSIFRLLRAKTSGLGHHNEVSLPQPDINGSDINQILRPHINSYVPAYKQRLRNLITLVNKNNTVPVLVTQPALYGDGTVAWSILNLYNKATKSVGEEEGVKVVDLANKLEKSLENFYDYIHFTNSGSAKVAKIIHHELQGNHNEETNNRTIRAIDKYRLTSSPSMGRPQ